MKRVPAIFTTAAFLCLSMTLQAESKATKEAQKRLSGETGPYMFSVIGDNRSGDRVYLKIMQQIAQRKPLFVVNTGDLIPNPGNRDQWRHFWEMSRRIDVPYFLVPGNHDIDSVKSEEVWRDEVDLPGIETYYSFVVGKDLYVILNSCDPKNEKKIVGEQLTWLNRILDPEKYRHQFVFLHHPLFMWKGASRYKESLDKYPEFRDKLHRIFVQKEVDTVLMGHEHTFKRQGKIDGVEYIITGGAGAPLYSAFNNVMFIDVDDKIIRAKVVDRDGNLRDEFFIKGP